MDKAQARRAKDLSGGDEAQGGIIIYTGTILIEMSSPSMPLLIFWPLLALRRWHCFFRLCALLLWCELYDMRDTKQKMNAWGHSYIY